MALNGQVTLCYDHRIIEEYREVLSLPRFGFSDDEVTDFLSFMRTSGMSMIAAPLPLDFPDDKGKMFVEVAMQLDAAIITGNKKHFPAYEKLYTPAEFLALY